MIKHINSFSGISPIKPNTLVVLDIDDTIISFPNIHKDWWNETYTNLYYYDKQNAYKQTNLLWLDRIVKSKPSLIDKKNFNKFKYYGKFTIF
jgi:predicted methyltransferase